MTDYVLVENRQIIHLGPMGWKPRMFQSELQDLEVDFTLPPAEPGYLQINESIEIFPVAMDYIDYNPLFDELVGPFWRYEDNVAHGYYTKQDGNIDSIKGNMKNIVAGLRYNKEQTPFQYTIQGQTVTVDASRENRNVFVQKYQFMTDTDTVDWKFPETWLTLTKPELGELVNAGATYIQEQFNWEKGYVDRIEAVTSIDELKFIHAELFPPPEPEVV